MARINWIPGWASSFSIWRDLIYETFPQYDHVFWSYEELKIFEDPLLLESITSKFKDDIFIGWSLGSQLIFENPQAFEHIKKIICIAPVFEFCHSEFGWRPQIIDRMIRKLNSAPESVLSDFSKNMGSDSKSSTWIEYAAEQTTENLIWGLEKLKQGKIVDLTQFSANLHCIFGNSDTIMKPELVNHFANTFNFITFSCCENMEHWALNPETLNEIQRLLNE